MLTDRRMDGRWAILGNNSWAKKPEGLRIIHMQMHWAFPVQRGVLTPSNEKHRSKEMIFTNQGHGYFISTYNFLASDWSTSLEVQVANTHHKQPPKTKWPAMYHIPLMFPLCHKIRHFTLLGCITGKAPQWHSLKQAKIEQSEKRSHTELYLATKSNPTLGTV